MKIFETREHAERRVKGILEVCKHLQNVPSDKLFEAVENYSTLNEGEELGEILNQVLDNVKEEHPELVSAPEGDDKASVASDKTDKELFYGEYKLKLNLTSLSDGYIEIVVSKNGIETIKVDDEPKEEEKKDDEKKEEEKKDEHTSETSTPAGTEEGKTPEGDQTGNNPEKKESKSDDRKPINENKKDRVKYVKESYDDKVDDVWVLIDDCFNNLHCAAAALITEDEVVFIDECTLKAFEGEQQLVDRDKFGLNLLDVVHVRNIKSTLDVRNLEKEYGDFAVYSFDNEDGENVWDFTECTFSDIVNALR